MKLPKKSLGRKLLEVDEVARSIKRSKVDFNFNKDISTKDEMLAVIRADENLPQMGRKKLWKVLHELNFCWEKQKRKSIFIDKEEIICWRI